MAFQPLKHSPRRVEGPEALTRSESPFHGFAISFDDVALPCEGALYDPRKPGEASRPRANRSLSGLKPHTGCFPAAEVK